MARDGAAVIGKEITVRGEVEGRQDLRIEGQVEGQVRLQAEVRVAEGGRLAGEVDADVLAVEGRFEGTATCAGRVHLLAGCDAAGTLQSGRIVIDEGAIFNGTLDMDVGPAAPGEAKHG
jgi:cytoskeletal protein CcmA (bactofilin family)